MNRDKRQVVAVFITPRRTDLRAPLSMNKISDLQNTSQQGLCSKGQPEVKTTAESNRLGKVAIELDILR